VFWVGMETFYGRFTFPKIVGNAQFVSVISSRLFAI